MIKIKEELFVDKKHHLEFVYVSIDSVSEINFMILLQIQYGNFFPPTETPTSQILSLSWYLLVQLLHLPRSFETVAKREAVLNPVPKQGISKDSPIYGSQSERAKIAIH